HYPAVQEIEKIRGKWVDGSNLTMTLEGKEGSQIEAWLRSLKASLHSCPLVDHADTQKVGYQFFYDHRLLFIDLEDLETGRDRLEREIQRKKLGGFFVDLAEPEDEEFYYSDLEKKYSSKVDNSASTPYIRNKEKTLYSMQVFAKGTDTSLTYHKKFFESVRQCTEQWNAGLTGEKPIGIYYTGKAKNRVDEYNTVVHDLKIAGAVSISAMLLLLIIYFRSFFLPVVIFTPLAIGLVAAFGLSSLFVDQLNIITAFLYTILSGLGIESGIHFVSRYTHARFEGQNREKALHEVIFQTGRSIGFSVAAVATIFFSLLLNDFRGFSQFGLIAGIGLCCAYFSYLLFFIPTIVAFENLKLFRRWRPPLFSKKEEGEISAEKSSFWPKTILWGGVLLTLFSIWVGTTREIFEYDFSKLKARIPESVAAKEKYRQTVERLVGTGAILIHSKEEAAILKKTVREKMETDEASPTIESFFSYFDLVPVDQERKMEDIKEMETMLEDDALELVSAENRKDLDTFKTAIKETTLIKPIEVPHDVERAFRGDTGEGWLAFIQPKAKSLDDGRAAIQFYEDVGKIQTPLKTFYTVSDPLIFANVLLTMMRDAPRAIAVAIFIILILLWIDQRRFKKIGVIVLPILLGELWLLGFLHAAGWKLDFYSMVIVPTIMGMSIDNCIHIYHRYQEVGKGSIWKVMNTAGIACVIASTTNALGFLGLVFANHGGLASLGRVAIVGLLTTLLSTTVFFPAFLAILERKKS
ncbi:MAG: MMPL family transporter, partial [Deltaproteobacteria bacterium]|nr:MMPL family transporter [Deltaproteobacteria bacterium]